MSVGRLLKAGATMTSSTCPKATAGDNLMWGVPELAANPAVGKEWLEV
jgi:hypothetical protein